MSDSILTLATQIPEVTQVSGSSRSVATGELRQNLPPTGKELPLKEPVEKPSEANLEQAVSYIEDHVQRVSRELQFEIDKDINDVIVTVIDRDTGDVIRQIPQDEIVKMARHLAEYGPDGPTKGLFINTDALM